MTHKTVGAGWIPLHSRRLVDLQTRHVIFVVTVGAGRRPVVEVGLAGDGPDAVSNFFVGSKDVHEPVLFSHFVAQTFGFLLVGPSMESLPVGNKIVRVVCVARLPPCLENGFRPISVPEQNTGIETTVSQSVSFALSTEPSPEWLVDNQSRIQVLHACAFCMPIECQFLVHHCGALCIKGQEGVRVHVKKNVGIGKGVKNQRCCREPSPDGMEFSFSGIDPGAGDLEKDKAGIAQCGRKMNDVRHAFPALVDDFLGFAPSGFEGIPRIARINHILAGGWVAHNARQGDSSRVHPIESAIPLLAWTFLRVVANRGVNVFQADAQQKDPAKENRNRNKPLMALQGC
mmetsp:Transcript_12054/g.30545  ORF Transcript_12054/g.30545 Transcript_12054/m.30545 type:complete len:344 (+) Transcript_12054:197-1228(+)